MYNDYDVSDTVLLFVFLDCVSLEMDELMDNVESLLARHIREQRRLNTSLPAEKKRVLWSHFTNTVSNLHFRRMFRMDIGTFDVLANVICENIGEERFKPESWLNQRASDNRRSIPPISGEVKLGLSLRLLAGGSYLDLVPLFSVSTSHLYSIFDDFLDWILQTLQFPLARNLRERQWGQLKELANLFAEKSNGVFYGAFGAIDGLAIRIRSPSKSEVPDPGNYFCRKGFYAINVQAICDKRKRFLWCFPTNKGSTHDAAAFAGSRLFDLLKEMTNDLEDHGLFIVGDSAYCLAPFLQIPYDSNEVKADVEHAKDGFNYHLSSCRIYIECAFGELVMRWGIFWRTLLFDLKKSGKIVQVAMLLHNFIVDCRESTDDDNNYFLSFNVKMNAIQDQLTKKTGEMPVAAVTDNNEPGRRGRRTIEETTLQEQGKKLRHLLTVKLAANGMRRPMLSDMHYNEYGHIYMTS
jgi:hypothetical protein